ncbi:hypothetical protein SEVIR_8G235300v4 [Setaria viridis]|uniref:Uncharacterized protein n=1 Tax=Setaria viridis TaxID=4556 RepID=A0A4U6TMR9_SETVI|nr:hypothetical protein SEVIR_8G235300v2 [Setaria viridis]
MIHFCRLLLSVHCMIMTDYMLFECSHVTAFLTPRSFSSHIWSFSMSPAQVVGLSSGSFTRYLSVLSALTRSSEHVYVHSVRASKVVSSRAPHVSHQRGSICLSGPLYKESPDQSSAAIILVCRA